MRFLVFVCSSPTTPRQLDRYEFRDLASHPAIIVAPYQVSIMSLFEQYSMAIPLLVPSRRLAAEWGIVFQRTWAGAFGHADSNGSAIPPHPSATTSHDPNSNGADAVMHWLGYADFYTWPHILVWDSVPELIEICECMHRCREA